MNAFEKYFARHTDLDRWLLVAGNLTGVEQAVVIPVLAERDSLFMTLDSLARNDEFERRRTLVVCVVNNRCGADGSAENQETLERLKPLVANHGALRIGYIDASSQGCEFAEDEGVGLARKLGMDWALSILSRNACTRGALICLDGDTLVQPNYLGSVRKTLSAQKAWAAVIDYAHPLEIDKAVDCRKCDPTAYSLQPKAYSLNMAIVCYECFLRYHVMGLRLAGSPYAFHTIGSAMACRADAYVAVSGMKPRLAGEDFYFLQALAKTGPVALIHDTTVYPSARESERVPFGTGARVRRHLAGIENEYLLYDPRCYEFLRDWFRVVEQQPDAEAEALLEQAGPLRDFLAAQGFADTWPRLQKNSRDAKQLIAQFHRWFDGFRTIKCLHYLRDNGYPPVASFDAIASVLSSMGMHAPELGPGIEHDLDRQKALLWRLRDWAATDTGPRGVQGT